MLKHFSCALVPPNHLVKLSPSNIYRPQRSCGKVMFLHLSVSHSVHRGSVYPSMHCSDTPSWADISQHALGQTPPPGQTYPSMHWGRHPLLGRHIPACTGADTLRGQTPPPPWRRLLLRTARILLECILV